MLRAVREHEHRMIERGFRMVRRSTENAVRTLGANPLPTA
jgi:ABC-type sulfate transport system permease component